MTMMTGLAAPIAAALAAKGYSTLTPVQEAVLAPDLAGADLLVSAQTGSGKTVAFGLAIAPDILGEDGTLPAAGKPLALVIAPTRELALQVRREFEWLFAGAGGVIASCVGGMDWRTERRALERGAQIVVGTPGRLRDHIERGSLDLTAARAAVLDEADEMLDLGFAEDLGFILSALPQPRRVLMFSATVPKGIEALAAEHQTGARRVSVAGEGAQHADIAYRAVSVGARDRDAAIFNLLRLHDSARAIVFAKTRANVNHLFARMINRGFQAVALSGELSQSERLHALQSLRDGRSRVCIATDVAARGIDLPGLDLVIHADLPTNAEGLLHRSGRTGRAGAKGTSCLIVAPADYRKASRILREANVEAEWTKPPTAAEVQAAEDARLLDHPALSADASEEDAALAAEMLDRHGALRVAGAFVRLWREGRAAPEVLSDEAMLPDRPAAPPRPRSEFGAAVWFEIGVGHEGRAEARWLLPKLCDAGGVDKAAIGAIRVQSRATFVQVAEAQAGRFAGMTELEPGLSLRRIEGEPAMERPERPERDARDGRPAQRDEGDRPRKPYSPIRRDEGDAPRKPYAPRPAAADGDRPRKPYTPRPRDEGDAPRKPYAPRPAAADGDRPRKPYTPRPRDDGDAPRKPYAPRPAADGDRPRKPYTPRPRDDGDAPRKPYAPRPAAADGDRPRKPYTPRPRDDGDAPRKPYAPRPAGAEGEAPRKPRWKAADRAEGGEAARPRSAGFKSHGGGAKGPGRATGFKSHKTEGAGGDRPFARKAPAKGAAPKAAPAMPPRPPADPRDTSRRFTPPKKPKG